MSLLSSLFRRSEKRRAYADLMHLEERMLRDIGLTRADVHVMMVTGRGIRSRNRRDHE